MKKSDPFDDLVRLRKEMDEILIDLYVGTPLAAHRGHPFRPAVDICYPEDQSHVTVTFELAGVRPEDIKITVAGRTLQIEGTRSHKGPVEQFYHHMEIDFGYFRRKLMLPFAVDAERCKITYDAGFLVLDFPVASGKESARRVPVTVKSKSGTGAEI